MDSAKDIVYRLLHETSGAETVVSSVGGRDGYKVVKVEVDYTSVNSSSFQDIYWLVPKTMKGMNHIGKERYRLGYYPMSFQGQGQAKKDAKKLWDNPGSFRPRKRKR